MKLTKLSLAMASVIGAGYAADALALDLYVDTKTQQIFAEPGKGRVLLGEFQKVGEAAAKPAETNELKAEIAQIKEDLALKDNALKALDEHAKANEEEVKVKLDNKGLQFESADKDFKFKLGGRIHADAAYHSGDDLVKAGTKTHNEANDGTEIRRARMEMAGTFYKDWEFRTVADFADNAVAMKDVYLRYSGWDLAHITAGQQKQNFSRELMESSNDLMFMERSLMDVLNNPVVDRAIGLNLNSKGKQWTAALGIFGDSITPPTKTAAGSDKYDEGWGISSRLTYAPIQEKTKLIHLGIAGNYRTADDNAEVAKSKALDYAYKSSHGSMLSLLEYKPTNVDSIKMVGLEASGLYGPFSAGGEYTRAWVDRDGGNNFTSDGWYAEAAWSITGESRKYKDGVFKYLEPAKKFSPKNGGWGAWELAARYSQVNLGKGTTPADDIAASNMTMALNWYINSNFRFMADYSRTFDFKNANVTYPNGAQPENMDVYMFRGQVAF